jgi:hypothetical protein
MRLHDVVINQIYSAIRSNSSISSEELEQMIDFFYKMFYLKCEDKTFDRELIIREALNTKSIWTGGESILEDNRDHVEWYRDKKSSLEDMVIWNRYYDYLITIAHRSPVEVDSVDKITDKIMERIEDPKREGSWDRRGMIVGDVQSGKTTNMTGLACKAAAAGYKYIIILSGMTDDLRCQTQGRMDEGLLGYDTRKFDHQDQSTTRVGVGTLLGYDEVPIHSVTNNKDKGDFNKTIFSTVSVRAGGNPILFVVKKNASILKNLYNELARYSINGKINKLPLLLIDDEADSASVDGKQVERDENGKPLKDSDPAKINQWIRKILGMFSKSAYVGYTATPFANIFIYPRTKDNSDKYGEDLFPRSFIINLPSPSSYIGPVKVFGLTNKKNKDESVRPLPITIKIDDYKEAFPNSHQKDFIIEKTPDFKWPESFRRAMKCFYLTCAAREARGQKTKHNSMLIHVTRFKNVQEQVSEHVSDELLKDQRIISFGRGKELSDFYDDLKDLWYEEYQNKQVVIREMVDDNLLIELDWEKVRPYIAHAITKIEVKTVNGDHADGGLKYEDYKEVGLSVIAIGGNKLSRGLTLEGLSVSYFTRASKMYDTLLQMGRWFGYKPGFVDLCRLFTTRELISWYEHITVANEELKREFDHMAAQGANPEEYGLKVRTHPDGLLVTSTNKMRNTHAMEVEYAGHLCETTRFYRNDIVNRKNLTCLEEWIKSQRTPDIQPNEKHLGVLRWNNVEVESVVDFLDGFQVHRMCCSAYPQQLKDFIIEMNKHDELKSWTVAVVSSSTGDVKNIAGYEIGLPVRSDINDEESEMIMVSGNHIISQEHETIDLSNEAYNRALENTILDWKANPKDKEQPKSPSPIHIRKQRDPRNGLLLIYPFKFRHRDDLQIEYDEIITGYAISFPDSKNAEKVVYKANNVYWREHYESEE